MITQSEFLARLGISHKTLKMLQERGLFKPVCISPSGKRIYYSEEQVDEYMRYEGLSAMEFSNLVGVAISTLYAWNDTGRLKADHVNSSGHLRYCTEQVDKYFAGDYDGIYEDGYIDRKTFSESIGVSESTLVSWEKKGLLLPDHKSVTRKWQYSPEQIETAKKLKKNS